MLKQKWNQYFTKPLIREAFRSGSIAAIVMIPFALLFSSLGLRINEYGKKVIQLLFSNFSPGIRFALFILEHFILSWIFAIPLLLLLMHFHRRFSYILLGFLYGTVFYILINSLLLPALFNEVIPWKAGFIYTILPSLVVHIVYGLSIAFTTRHFINKRKANSFGI